MIKKTVYLLLIITINTLAKDDNLKGFVFEIDFGPGYDFTIKEDTQYKINVIGADLDLGFGAGFTEYFGWHWGIKYKINLLNISDKRTYYNTILIFTGVIVKKDNFVFNTDVGFYRNSFGTEISASYLIKNRLRLGVDIGVVRMSNLQHIKIMIPLGLKLGVMVF